LKTLLSIQYLRAAAALAVVVYHASQWGGPVLDVGRAGVDVFFVISGVIMWTVTGRAERAPGRFLWRRFTRVAPFYWLVTLALTAVALVWPDFLDNVHPETGHVLLSLAFIPHMDPKGQPFPLYGPGWSLNYEAFFYLLFGAALLAPRRRQAVIVCGALAATVAGGILLTDPVYQLGANPMLLQFAAGVAIARLAEMRMLPGRRGGWALIVAGFVAFAVPAAFGIFSELWRPLLWGAPAALLVAGAVAVEADGGAPDWPFLALLGDASFALYLTHEPAQALVAHTLGWSQPWLFRPLAIVAAIAAGLACHKWIEKPLTAGLRRAPNLRPGRAPADGRTAPDQSPPSPSQAETAS
jgi:exopolysaccharide production protein ExoZ